MAGFFNKLCEKCYRRSCKYMRNNSTRLQGEKKTWSSQYQSFEHNGIEICEQQRLESLEEKKGGCTLHGGMASEEFANFIPKDDQPANSRDANPLITIWIIVHGPWCDNIQRSSPQNTGLAKTATTLRLEIVNVDTLWELVHSIPHRLENVRNHKGRHSGC